jgi:hypothetical protein
MAPQGNKITAIVIINGEGVPVETNANSPLHVLVQHALQASGNTVRDAQEWELRNTDGALIDTTRSASDLGLTSGTKLFLSLKVGAGGSDANRS